MSLYKTNLRFPLPWAILSCLVILVIICIVIFVQFRPAEGTWGGPGGLIYIVTAGLIPGLVVALGQYCLSWFEFKELDRLKQLKIKRILLARDEEDYYGDLIQNSTEKIMVMGVTASRFLDDFAAMESKTPKKRVLLDALSRGVQVQLFVADKNFLNEKDRDLKFPRAEARLRDLMPKYPSLEVKYYKHAPTHSMVVVDEECLLGPIFSNVDSKDTPAIHTHTQSRFAKSYLQYFEHDWNES